MTVRRTVLLLSAGVTTAVNVMAALRASARYAVRVVAADMDEWAPGLYLADAAYRVPRQSAPDYVDRVLSICRAEGVDLLIPLHSGEMELIARHRAVIEAAGVRLVLPDPDVIALCNDKRRFLDILEAEGFPVPARMSPDATRYPAFARAVTGSGSTAAARLAGPEDLAAFQARHPDCLVQEYVDWPEVTVDGFVSREGALIAAVPRLRLKTRGGQAVVARTVAAPVVEETVRRLLCVLGLRGACNVQLFLRDGAVKVIEVNPRLAAGGLPLAVHAGANIPELMLREADGETLAPVSWRPDVTMVRYPTEVFFDAGQLPRLL